MGEIENVVNILKRNNKKNFALLQCTSHYPAKPSQINLRAMKTIRSAFDCMVGYSDHTMGINISLAAVALGAKIIEKHFTLDSRKLGCDHKASIEPHELKNLVSGIREVESSLGTSEKIITKDEQYIYKIHRPSIVSKCLIRKGSIIKKNMLDFKKPGTGISPLNIDFVIGRKTKKTIKKNRLIKSADLI